MNRPDPPQTLTPSQMARRKIAAKKRPHRPAPLPSGEAAPTWAPNPADANKPPGALFGGSIMAPSAFTFEVPAPVGGEPISFGQKRPFQAGTGTGMTNSTSFGNIFQTPGAQVQDERADTTGEDAARKNKPFQVTWGATSAAQSPTKNEWDEAREPDMSHFKTLISAPPPDM